MLEMTTPRPSFSKALKVWFKLGCLSFGGPDGQIALMHRIVVDEKKWLSEPQFLHALNFCMLLPGPEATELATYAGWLLHAARGGLVAGLFFVLPGALVMVALSLLYVYGRGPGPIEGALFGIKATVLVIVVEALIRIGRRALKSHLLAVIAAAVVGEVLKLSVWFALHLLFGEVVPVYWGPLRWFAFDPYALDNHAAVLAVTAAILAFRFRRGLIEVVIVMALLGIATHFYR